MKYSSHIIMSQKKKATIDVKIFLYNTYFYIDTTFLIFNRTVNNESLQLPLLKVYIRYGLRAT